MEHFLEGCQCEGKACTKCTTLKCIGAFHKSPTAKSGLQAHCKKCRSDHAKKVRVNFTDEQKQKQRESSRSYHQTHREQCLQGMRQRYQENAEYHRAYGREHGRTYKQTYPERIKVSRMAHYQQHIEMIRLRDRRRYSKYAERVKTRTRNYYYAHREQQTLARKRWLLNNYERYMAYKRTTYSIRRTRKTQAGGSYTDQEWRDLKTKYNFTCLCCGRKEPEIKLTVDHVIPVTKQGTSNIENIQPLCKSCNSRKNNKIIDYRR